MERSIVCRKCGCGVSASVYNDHALGCRQADRYSYQQVDQSRQYSGQIDDEASLDIDGHQHEEFTEWYPDRQLEAYIDQVYTLQQLEGRPTRGYQMDRSNRINATLADLPVLETRYQRQQSNTMPNVDPSDGKAKGRKKHRPRQRKVEVWTAVQEQIDYRP